MRLSEINLNKTEYADKEGLYFEPLKNKLEHLWDELRLYHTIKPKDEPNPIKFMSILSQASTELTNNLIAYSDCRHISAEKMPDLKINLKPKIIDELVSITEQSVKNFKKAIEDEKSVWNRVSQFKYLGIQIVDGTVAVGNNKYFIEYDKSKGEFIYPRDDVKEIICEVSLFNFKSRCSSREFQREGGDKNESKIEQYLEFLKFKEKCQKFENGELKVEIFIKEEKSSNSNISKSLNSNISKSLKSSNSDISDANNILNSNVRDQNSDYKDTINENNFDTEENNIVEENATAEENIIGGENNFNTDNIISESLDIADFTVAKFVFQTVMNDLKIADFVAKIYNLIIGTIVSEKGACNFFEYENEYYFVNDDVYRVESKNGNFIIYKNEIEVKEF